MSLVADYSSSDIESNTEEDYDKPAEEIHPARIYKNGKILTKLPRADILLNKSAGSGEVFNNPYKLAENAKIKSLEKHVKMVDTQQHVKTKNGKKICWNHRKGRCRFGSNCTFAHDSDLQISDEQLNSKLQNIPSGAAVISNTKLSQVSDNIEQHSISAVKRTDKDVKRKRPGLSDTIIPGKKVIKQYNAMKKL